MPTGNISWGKLSPKEESLYKKRKNEANNIANPQVNDGITDVGKKPAPLKRKAGSPSNAFASLKAYNTRANRTVFSK